MKNTLTAFLLLAAVGCKAPKYIEPEPTPIDRPEPPPQRVLRLPVNHSFKTSDGKKEYRLRMYSDDEITDDIVTCIDGGAFERLVKDPGEYEFAMGEFLKSWANAGQVDQLDYHRRLFDAEARKRATLLDDMIIRKTEQIAKLENDRFDVNADYTSRAAGYKEKDKPDLAPALQQEVARLDVLIVAEKARLQLLEYQRYLRDNGDSMTKLKSDIDRLKGLMGQ
jgi:hypothetical protein